MSSATPTIGSGPLSSGIALEMTVGEAALWRAAEYLRAHPAEPSPIRADVIAAQDALIASFADCGRELNATAVRILTPDHVPVHRIEIFG